MRVSIGYRSIRLFASEQWDLLRDIFGRIGELVRPRIELIRTRLKKSRVASRKDQLLELLGEEASSGIRTSGDWLEQVRRSEKVKTLIKRINGLERLEKKFRLEASLLEETSVIWLLTNLTAELSSRKLEVKAHWIQDGSSFMGFPSTKSDRNRLFRESCLFWHFEDPVRSSCLRTHLSRRMTCWCIFLRPLLRLRSGKTLSGNCIPGNLKSGPKENIDWDMFSTLAWSNDSKIRPASSTRIRKNSSLS